MPDREKVLGGLEFIKAMITFDPSTGEDIDPETLNDANKTSYDACVGAIALLKEQEAAKPEVGNICGYSVYICGKCKSDLITRVKFCPWCGQAVKWDG